MRTKEQHRQYMRAWRAKRTPWQRDARAGVGGPRDYERFCSLDPRWLWVVAYGREENGARRV